MIHYAITAAILIALIGALVENIRLRKELEASRKGWETRRAKRLGERLPIAKWSDPPNAQHDAGGKGGGK